MVVSRIHQFQPFKFLSYGLWLIFGVGVFGLKKINISEKSLESAHRFISVLKPQCCFAYLPTNYLIYIIDFISINVCNKDHDFNHCFIVLIKGIIIYYFYGRSPSRHHLAGALMEHFLEVIAPLRHWHINPNEKSNKYKSSLLS